MVVFFGTRGEGENKFRFGTPIVTCNSTIDEITGLRASSSLVLYNWPDHQVPRLQSFAFSLREKSRELRVASFLLVTMDTKPKFMITIRHDLTSGYASAFQPPSSAMISENQALFTNRDNRDTSTSLRWVFTSAAKSSLVGVATFLSLLSSFLFLCAAPRATRVNDDSLFRKVI